MGSVQVFPCEDKSAWNQAVFNLGGSLYHSWEWGEIRQMEGWHPWRILATVDREPCAAVQVLEKRLPAGVASIFYAPRGITGHDEDKAIVQEILLWLQDLCKRRRGIVLRMDPPFKDTNEVKKSVLISSGLRWVPEEWSFWNLQRSGMIVDISGTEEEILQKMRPTHRRTIHRAIREGLSIEVGTDISDFKDFYGLLLKSSQRQGFPVRGFENLCIIREKLFGAGKGILLIAKHENQPAAGIICCQFGKVCYYLYGGFDWDSRKTRATEPLHWRALQWAKASGCTTYDLMGSGTLYPPAEGNRGFGLYHFKKGFGAELVRAAGYFDLVGSKVLYNAIRFAELHPKLIDSALGLRSLLRLG